MQRRVEETDRDGLVEHNFVHALEVFLLHRQKFSQIFFSGFSVLRKDHAAYGRDSVFVEEHMFCTAQTDSFCAEFKSLLCISRRVGVRSDVHRTAEIRPFHDLAEVAGKFRSFSLDRAFVYVACRTVE